MLCVLTAGEAVVLGWERAITWDGRTVTPLLTDSCHHLLVLLTRTAPYNHHHTSSASAPSMPTAVTLHLQQLSAREPLHVLTIFTNRHVVTLDSRLKVGVWRCMAHRGVVKASRTVWFIVLVHHWHYFHFHYNHKKKSPLP